MKYLLTTLILSLLSNYSNGQISVPKEAQPTTLVGKIAPMGGFVAELSYLKNEADTTYFLRFRNAKYTHITSIESVAFSGVDNTVTELYKVFKSAFTDENKSKKDFLVQFTLGKNEVAISNTKSLGITSAMFTYKDAFFTLTEKQIDKLFGKN
jgi:hypothetical protein